MQAQQQKVTQDDELSPDAGRAPDVFNRTACINCHAISGTVADGRFGPDLTHLMSRETIASGAAEEQRRESAGMDTEPGYI